MLVTAAIGLVIGSGLYEIGIYGAFLTLIVLEVFRQLSNRLLSRHCGLDRRLRLKKWEASPDRAGSSHFITG